MTQGSHAWWHASATTITLEVSPSTWHFRLSICFITLTVLLWVGLLLKTQSPLMLIPGTAAAVLGMLEWRGLKARQELTLVLDPARELIALPETGQRRRISGALCLPWLVVLRCRPDDSRRPFTMKSLLIWRDSVTVADHRALRRWLRQREHQGEAGTIGSG